MANTIRNGSFYGIWPVLSGKPLNLLWGEIRSNQAELKALARGTVQELEEGVDELNALRALVGLRIEVSAEVPDSATSSMDTRPGP